MKTICLITYILSGVLLLTPGKSAPNTLPVLNLNLLESEPFSPVQQNTSESITGPLAKENQRQLLALESCQKSVLQNAVALVKSTTDCPRKPAMKETKTSNPPIEGKYKGVIPLYTSELPS
ncbi:hypothetical protein GU926_06005 [Nibribacter ruber]|uniref:Uncharacterized protein n=1 Tax=Nibribacter ruber TaxID=2698458 RepID=A0A6P1P1C2_9BACT|nr:hypothetical protein [Nibribacter ruber]QHL87012.1 hypothetical protein GU926_06005 [Nibribacter ruber]